MNRAPRLWPWWLLWVAFVVYGSLVPLDFKAVPLDQAWARLINAPMYKLGIESRADWVANGVLYFPVGLLTTSLLLGGRGAGAARAVTAALMAGLFGMALAGVVEFSQVFFPPRTVSRNDLLAESIGTWLGVLAALAIAHRLHALLASIDFGGATLARRLAPAYGLVYLGLALFPFDLLVSADEWSRKLHSGMVALVLAERAEGSSMLGQLAKLAIEVAMTLPLGAWWASRRRPGATGPAWPQALLLGALLGLAIELAQLAIASGVSQGASVLTRALGLAGGAAAWQATRGLHPEELRRHLRRATLPVLPPYLVALALHHGWAHGAWRGPEQALQRLQNEVNFVPFYYHYFTTEMHAVISLTAVSLSYAPVAVLGWAWHQGRTMAALLAMLLALLMETGKLFAEGSRPDPTNVLIAGVTVWVGHHLLTRLTHRPPAAATRR